MNRAMTVMITIGLALGWFGAGETHSAGPHRDTLRPVLAIAADIPSHEGRYRASLSPVSGSWDGASGWTLSLRTPEGEPVDGANPFLEGWMPDAAGMPMTPARSVIGVGRGEYRVEGLSLAQGGWWNIRLTIGPGTKVQGDSLAFNIELAGVAP